MNLDGFTFFNEFDLLNERLKLLDGVVDRHILVEANLTHQGEPKPLLFGDNMDRWYKDWMHKITYIVADLGMLTNDCWLRERYQFDAIAWGFPREGQHTVLLSNVDEIPTPDVFERYENAMVPWAASLQMQLYYYNMNTRCSFPWYAAKIISYMAGEECIPSAVRALDHSTTNVLLKAGKHCSYFGSAEDIQRKIMAFAHGDLNRAPFNDLDHIRKCMAEGVDLFGREGVMFERIAG